MNGHPKAPPATSVYSTSTDWRHKSVETHSVQTQAINRTRFTSVGLSLQSIDFDVAQNACGGSRRLQVGLQEELARSELTREAGEICLDRACGIRLKDTPVRN